jgi:hypothetical protein
VRFAHFSALGFTVRNTSTVNNSSQLVCAFSIFFVLLPVIAAFPTQLIDNPPRVNQAISLGLLTAFFQHQRVLVRHPNL